MGKGWKIFAPVLATAVIIVGLFLFLERPPNAAGIDPEDILIRGQDAFRRLEVVGNQEVRIYRHGRLVSKEEYPSPIEPWLAAKAGGMRPPQAAGRIIAYEYLSSIAKRMHFDDAFFMNHQVTMLGAKKLAGHWAWEVEVKPKTPDNGFLRIAFDKDTGYPLERVKYDRNGKKENSIFMSRIESIVEKTPGHFRPPRPKFKGRPDFERGPGNIFDNLRGPRPPGQGPGFHPPGFMPPEDFHRILDEGRALYPTFIPEGHQFKGVRKLPPGPWGLKEKLQLIFSDGVNVLSIFQISLPENSLHGGDTESYLRSKVKELQSSFPEGFAMRRVDEGLLVAVGDIAPEVLDEVLASMTQFKEGRPAWDENTPLDPEDYF